MDSKQIKNMALGAAGLTALVATTIVSKRLHQYSLRGKVVLITGGGRGLGLLLAREFAAEGARIAICARNQGELDQAVTKLQGQNVEVIGVRCDITNGEDVERMVSAVQDHYGRIDVLVNNAGIIEVGPMEEMTRDDYEEAMNTHFWGPLSTSLAVLPEMKRRREGRIVNISSIGGKIPVPHLLPYTASKFALVGLSGGMRAELAKDGVVVTTICPGLMRTGSPDNAYFKGQNRKEYAWFSIGDSLPGMSMSADEAARQIVVACKNGEAEVILSKPAQIAAKMYGLFPSMTLTIESLVGGFLPRPGGIGQQKVPGSESHSAVSPSIITALTNRAARDNNQKGLSSKSISDD